MEAIILAGGKAERLGAAAGGRPKALVEVAGRPLAAYQVELLARAGVDRVIVSCSTGNERLFEEGALRTIVQHSGGIPRRANILCHNARLFAYGRNLPAVTARVAA